LPRLTEILKWVSKCGVESLFLGWEWGFWGKFAIICKTFEKVAKIRKRRCKTFEKVVKDVQKVAQKIAPW
jgi:hypothetical protein